MTETSQGTRTGGADSSDESQSNEAVDHTGDADADGGDDPVVTVTDLRRGFGDVTVLDGLTFDVEPGTLVSLVGPNGSGKSTLLRIVAGVLAADGGHVDVTGHGARRVGYLPQRPSFRPGFSVGDTLRFYADLLGPDAAAAVDVEAVLDQVGLAAVRSRKVEALSGGMTRLLGLAQALLGDPTVLVLDEPASGLDPAISAHIFETVRSLADDGRAVVLASHDLVSVERTADRVLVLDQGTFVADGAPTDLVAGADADGLVDVFLEAISGEVGAVPTVRTGIERGQRTEGRR